METMTMNTTKEKKKETKKKDWMSQLINNEKSLVATDAIPKQKIGTASPSLNWALSGGFYKGYTTCLYGPEGSGKSLISMLAVAAYQQMYPDEYVVLISAEMRDPDPAKLRTLGVNPDKLIIRKVNTLHDVFDWIASMDEQFTHSDGSAGPPGLAFMLSEGEKIGGLIIDSIKAIKGPKEQASESTEQHIMGDISFFLNPALRKILPVIRDYNLMTIFVQQVTMNMNLDEVKYQNKKWTLPSGQALKHFCEVMALVERVVSKDSKLFSEEKTGIRDVAVQEGHTVRVRVEKANLDSPFREAEFRINYAKGIVDVGLEVALLGDGLGIISHPISEKTGKPDNARYEFGDKKWHGFDNIVAELETDPGLRREIMAKVYEAKV